MKTKYVVVDWVDIVAINGWRNRLDIAELEPDLCRSVGAVLRNDDKEIVLAATVGIDSPDDSTCLHVISIPQGCVRKIRRLKV